MANNQNKPMTAFDFMNRYRLPILLVCALGMVGFGAWGTMSGGGADDEKWEEVLVTYELDGEKYEITRKELAQTPIPSNVQGYEDESAAKIATIIRHQMVDKLGVSVSDAEFKKAFDKQVIETIKSTNDGVFDKERYKQWANQFYNIPTQEFERRFRHDMRLAKLVRDIDRGAGDVTMSQVYEKFTEIFGEIKLKGVFFSRDDVAANVKLETEEKDGKQELTAAAREKLLTWWQGLTEERKKQPPFRQPAKLDADVIGFSFASLTDAELETAFNTPQNGADKSFADLTAEFTPTEADEQKMKLRLSRFREAYGLLQGSEVDAEFEIKKPRLIREWKIWRLTKKVYDDYKAKETAGETVDLEAVAKANGLIYFPFKKISVNELREHETFPGSYAFRLQQGEENKLFTFQTGLGPNSPWFDVGPVDEVGKHASVWVVRAKDLTPIPLLDDVLDHAHTTYEKEAADQILEDSIKAFEDSMNAILDEKVKDFADKVNADTKAEIAKETEGLDPEKDKEQIEETTKALEADAEDKIKDEKAKYRQEAFTAALKAIEDRIAGGEKLSAVVVEEGFFNPLTNSRWEQAPDKEKASFEAKARFSLRREFSDLHDQAYQDKFVEVGTVSDRVASTQMPGITGIAMLVEKRKPTLDEMLSRPIEMRQAEDRAYTVFVRPRDNSAGSLWDYESLKKSSFNVVATELEADMAKIRERKLRDESALDEYEKARQERLRKAREANKPKPVTPNPDEKKAANPDEKPDGQ